MSCARWASPFRNSRSRWSSASRDKLGQGRGCADYLTALEPLDLGRGGRQDARGRQIGPAGAGYFDNDSTRHVKGMVFGAGSKDHAFNMAGGIIVEITGTGGANLTSASILSPTSAQIKWLKSS